MTIFHRHSMKDEKPRQGDSPPSPTSITGQLSMRQSPLSPEASGNPSRYHASRPLLGSIGAQMTSTTRGIPSQQQQQQPPQYQKQMPQSGSAQKFREQPAYHGTAPPSTSPRPAETAAPNRSATAKDVQWMSAAATKDEVLLTPSQFPILQPLAKRCILCKVGPSLFASMIRLARAQAVGHTVLDCRARDLPRSLISRKFEAIELCNRLPGHRDCTEEIRENFKAFLKSVTHLKAVFLFDHSPVTAVLPKNTFLARIVKYIGTTDSIPKKLVFLEGGIDCYQQLPLARSIMESPVDFYVATLPKPGRSCGIFVIQGNRNPGTVDLIRICQVAQINIVVNVYTKPIDLGNTITTYAPGPESLPLKTKEEAVPFYTNVINQILKSVQERANVLIIDGHQMGLASLWIAIALVTVGHQEPTEAVSLVRNRLGATDFDAFAMAALSHLFNTKVVSKAANCLAERHADTTAGEAGQANVGKLGSPQGLKTTEATDLLKGHEAESLQSSWDEIRELMGTAKYNRQQKDEMFRLFETIFNNVLLHPNDPKYRQIREANPKFAKYIGNDSVGRRIFIAAGWKLYTDKVWRLPQTANLQLLRDSLVYIVNFR